MRGRIALDEELERAGLALLKELVAVESTSPAGAGYDEVIGLLKDFLAAYGVSTEAMVVPREYQAQFCPTASERPRTILKAWVGGKGDVLLHLNGHYDVVPGGPGWTVTDPFKPRVVEDRVYGRGTTDMKGGITSIALSLAIIARAEEGLPGRVEAAFVPDEEIGGACGTGYLVERATDKVPPYVVIAEPTNLERIEIGHKGGVWVRVVVRGRTAHASRPWLGENAFVLGARIAAWLADNYVTSLQAFKSKYAYDDPLGNTPTAMVGGEAYVPSGKSNQVPGEFHFTIDRRFVIEEELEAVKREVIQAVTEAARFFGAEDRVKAEVVSAVDKAFVPPGNRLSIGIRQVAAVLGLPNPVETVCIGATDARYYVKRGSLAVSYGPGDPRLAHAPDEYVEYTKVLKAAEAYALLPAALLALEESRG